MCRWIAYLGEPIYLETLVVNPEHSLILQSLFAQQNYISDSRLMDQFPHDAFPTNGDGFGFGWYGSRDVPGRYRDCRPAWNDHNLRDLAAQIRSHLFLAHIRLGPNLQRSNNHPFVYKNWLFQHNGELGGWLKLKRSLQTAVREDLFPLIEGNTDSETVFYLMMTYGMEQDVFDACRKAIGHVEKARRAAGIEDPFLITCCMSDGESLYALRYASDDENPKTLYYNENDLAIEDMSGSLERIPKGARVLVSEPLDDIKDHWTEVPPDSFVSVTKGEVSIKTFEPSH